MRPTEFPPPYIPNPSTEEILDWPLESVLGLSILGNCPLHTVHGEFCGGGPAPSFNINGSFQDSVNPMTLGLENIKRNHRTCWNLRTSYNIDQ